MKTEKEWFCDEVKKCEKCMYMVAFNILQNDEDTKDAMGDAILKAYCNLNLLKERSKFKSWIMKILVNATMDLAKKRNRSISMDDIQSDVEPSIQPDYENRLLLKEAVEKLTHPYRTIVILFYYQEFSVKEISEIMDSNVNTVKKQLQRAREKLKKMI